MVVPWDEPFEQTLRDALTHLPTDAPLKYDTSLGEHGME